MPIHILYVYMRCSQFCDANEVWLGERSTLCLLHERINIIVARVNSPWNETWYVAQRQFGSYLGCANRYEFPRTYRGEFPAYVRTRGQHQLSWQLQYLHIYSQFTSVTADAHDAMIRFHQFKTQLNYFPVPNLLYLSQLHRSVASTAD